MCVCFFFSFSEILGINSIASHLPNQNCLRALPLTPAPVTLPIALGKLKKWEKKLHLLKEINW